MWVVIKEIRNSEGQLLDYDVIRYSTDEASARAKLTHELDKFRGLLASREFRPDTHIVVRGNVSYVFGMKKVGA